MKKFGIFALMMCVLSLVACKDEKEPEQTTEKKSSTAAANLKVDFSIDEAALNVLEISFDYLDEKGEKHNEPMQGNAWSKHVQSETLPATLGFRMVLAKKEGVDAATLGKFTFSYTYSFSTASVNSNGQEGDDLETLTISPKQTISENKLDAFIQSANETPLLGLKVLYDAHGVRTITNWE